MAKDIDKAGDGAATGPDKSTAKAELPRVDSPPLSPGEEGHDAEVEQTAAAPDATLKPAQTAIALIPAPKSAPETAPGAIPRIRWSPRRKRAALLAASVAFAAALGAVVGALSSGGFATPAPRNDVAAGEESKAMQKSIAHLSKEVASLKANLEAASKAAHSQVAKISERLAGSAQEITGSISAPQTVAPLPTPRPSLKQEPRVAAVETQPPARPAVVQDWTIRGARDGFVYVEGHGEIYQVVPGAPLPGLGPVQTIAQRDGRWVVVTPRGIIVSMRDRRYFEQF